MSDSSQDDRSSNSLMLTAEIIADHTKILRGLADMLTGVSAAVVLLAGALPEEDERRKRVLSLIESSAERFSKSIGDLE